MIYAVLLCDKNWKIERILHQTLQPDFFQTGSVFTELVSDPEDEQSADRFATGTDALEYQNGAGPKDGYRSSENSRKGKQIQVFVSGKYEP